ncbi:MAG: DNA-3-methyladenine glycosylase I [gamma proteobacterium symbiont of Taylorina sp.]|nr:DNA-3-methyladenine glycosylase I [gamma proteobacterium symbiont of Taylorina sp.]
MIKQRCTWCGEDPLYQYYHDTQWGVPEYQDRMLFEMLMLEGAQAGLSWRIILKKRTRYQQVFDAFDAGKIAQYDQQKVARLMQDAGIIRNRLKINAIVNNARQFLEIQTQKGSFSEYIWQFVDGRPKVNHWQSLNDIPVATRESEQMSRSLKQKGFKFVGPTICYAYMQAVGMVNDHTIDCFRYNEVAI